MRRVGVGFPEGLKLLHFYAEFLAAPNLYTFTQPFSPFFALCALRARACVFPIFGKCCQPACSLIAQRSATIANPIAHRAPQVVATNMWTAPQWHLPARCREGDVNALFQYAGTWHLLQQWHLRPHSAVGHSTSPDLLRWTRVADALSAGGSAEEQCFDGSASLLDLNGTRTPVLMIDGGCGRKAAGHLPCMESSGNGSTGGVVAFPTQLTDADLASWRSLGPTVFLGCDSSAGPGPIFRLNDSPSSPLSLVAIHGGGEARFEAVDGTLTRWRMADPSFLAHRGGGGGLWHQLPLNVDGVTGRRWPTHIFQTDTGRGDGRPDFVFGALRNGRFTNASAPVAVDVGGSVAYGQLSSSGGTGVGGVAGDPRTLHVSWLVDRAQPVSPNCAVGGQLTSFRDLRYDPRIETLVETPIAEYRALRGQAIFKSRGVLLRADEPLAPLASMGAQQAAHLDAELTVALPPESHNGSIQLGVRCEAASSSSADCRAGGRIELRIGAGDARGWRRLAMSVTTPFERQVAECVMMGAADSWALPVRIMTDSRSLEVFVAHGRCVFSGVLLGSARGGALVAAAQRSDARLSSAIGWPLRAPDSAWPGPAQQRD